MRSFSTVHAGCVICASLGLYVDAAALSSAGQLEEGRMTPSGSPSPRSYSFKIHPLLKLSTVRLSELQIK